MVNEACENICNNDYEHSIGVYGDVDNDDADGI